LGFIEGNTYFTKNTRLSGAQDGWEFTSKRIGKGDSEVFSDLRGEEATEWEEET